MGGRGASSGISSDGKPYGSEYRTLLKKGNIKFIEQVANTSINAPMETMSENRIYVTLGKDKEPKVITFYDYQKRRFKHIDIKGKAHRIDGKLELPHKHLGYIHDENGSYRTSNIDKKIIEHVLKIWENRSG